MSPETLRSLTSFDSSMEVSQMSLRTQCIPVQTLNNRKKTNSFFLPRSRYPKTESAMSFYRASNCTTTLIKHDAFEIHEQMNLLRLVRFLYMIRWPHSRQRMGSRGFISFFALQSMFHRCSPNRRLDDLQVRTSTNVLHILFGDKAIADTITASIARLLLVHGG